MSDPQPNDASPGGVQQFLLQRIYLKDLSFESPASPHVFATPWQPQMRLEVDTRATPLGDAFYEVVLSLTLTAQQDGNTVCLIELQQAGVFLISGIQDSLMPQVLHVTCPTILFPYVRETVDHLALKGGLPPFLLAPLDFGALQRSATASRPHSDTQAP